MLNYDSNEANGSKSMTRRAEREITVHMKEIDDGTKQVHCLEQLIKIIVSVTNNICDCFVASILLLSVSVNKTLSEIIVLNGHRLSKV